jgi:hypothetical protein
MSLAQSQDAFAEESVMDALVLGLTKNVIINMDLRLLLDALLKVLSLLPDNAVVVIPEWTSADNTGFYTRLMQIGFFWTKLIWTRSQRTLTSLW